MEPSEDSPRSALVGEVLQNTYRIERRIGRGGMGAVYEASHLRLARRFAVKVLFPLVAKHPEALARFQTEAQVTSGLGHPHIIEVVDFNHQEDGTPYIVMELLEGENLEDRVEGRGRMEITQAASIFAETASALVAAHQKGVVHRDLKPQNIFLCNWGKRDDFVKVLDFGLSKVMGTAGMTRANSLMGSPCFMSPEQASAGAAEVDQRADVYAMGVILFWMLTGETPFSGTSLPALLQSIVNDPPPTLRSFRPDLPPVLESVMEQALCKDREQRFASMSAVWNALAGALRTAGWEVPDLETMTERPDQSLPRIKETNPPAEPAPLEPTLPPEPAAAAPPQTGLSSTLSSSVGQREPVEPPRRRSRALVPLVFGAVVLLSAGLFTLFLLRGKPVVEQRPASPSTGAVTVAAAPRLDAAPLLPDSALPPDSAVPDTAVPDSPPPAPDSARPVARRPRRRHRRPAPEPGILKVSTLFNGEPVVARVIVDGKRVGESPLYRRGVRAGTHRVTVRAPGFRPVTRPVVIEPGKKASIVLQLRRLK